MAYNPVDVAWKIVAIAAEKHMQLTHMQLQKLTYIAHGLSLAAYKTPLLNQPVAAWKFGPVIPSLYHEFKRYRSESITPQSATIHMSPDDVELLKVVVETYGHLSGVELSEYTHMRGTPWHKVWHDCGCQMNNALISDESIKNYYSKMLETQHCTGL